jgi:PKD repeat protein
LPSTTSTAVEEEEEETGLASISSILPPEPVGEVFDSFELISGEDIAQDPLGEEFALIEGGVEGEGEEIASLLTVDAITNGTEGEAPATFIFEADTLGGTEPYIISWDFGDGSEGSDEQSVEHTFDEAGTYNVALTVTDSDDETAFDSLEITVE